MRTRKIPTNKEISRLLRSVSAALELSGGDNRFRITAYQKAADSIEHASSEVKDLWDDGQLDTLSGIGESIAGYLDELFSKGRVKHFDRILKPFPPAVFELLDIPGLGPKSAYKLCKALGINKAHTAINKLQRAAKQGQVAEIEGFGEDSQSAIIQGIEEYENRSHRLLLDSAEKTASELTAWLRKLSEVKAVDPIGSLRRQAATIGDIDISVASANPEKVISHFISYPRKRRVLESGDRSASIILPNDHQVDLMVQPIEAYGSLLQHFTGSKHHNIALREHARKKGYSLSEYGIKTKDGMKLFKDEDSLYMFLGMSYIPPELRENNGEIEAAVLGQLPHLVEIKDIKGDMQIHSNIDVEPSHDLGESTVYEIARKAAELDYEYVALTEHNPSVSGHTDRQVQDIINMKTNIIQSYNQSDEKRRENLPYVFNGLEIDIQPDGKRAFPDHCLDLLDFACVSIHSSFRQSKDTMTRRVLSGMDHPKVKYLAHPTGRLLMRREGVELDWDKIFDFCLTHNKWLEIDAWPDRLDLPDTLVRQAISHGVKVIIDTDSHSSQHLVYMRYGVSVARRGWAKAGDIVNTKSLTEMRQLLNTDK